MHNLFLSVGAAYIFSDTQRSTNATYLPKNAVNYFPEELLYYFSIFYYVHRCYIHEQFEILHFCFLWEISTRNSSEQTVNEALFLSYKKKKRLYNLNHYEPYSYFIYVFSVIFTLSRKLSLKICLIFKKYSRQF